MSSGPFGIMPFANRRPRYNSGAPTPYDQPDIHSPRLSAGRAYGASNAPVDPSYLPPGYQAPSPQYLEDVSIANLRNRRRDQNAASNGIGMPPAPTYLLGGGRSGATMLAPGANIAGIAPTAKAPAGHVVTDPETFVKNPGYHEGSPATQPSVENPHPIPEFQKMRGGTHVEYAPGMAPATQPSAPAEAQAPPPQPDMWQGPNGTADVSGLNAHQRNQLYDQGARRVGTNAMGGSANPVTEQQAREMHRVMIQQNPHIPPEILAGHLANHLTQRYGVDNNAANQMVGAWSENNSLGYQNYAPPTSTPGARTPISMLGPDSSGGSAGSPLLPDPHVLGHGAYVQAPSMVTPGAPMPFPGYNPITPGMMPQTLVRPGAQYQVMKQPQLANYGMSGQQPQASAQPDYLPPDFNANAPRFQPPPPFTDSGDVHGSRAPTDPYHATQPRPAVRQSAVAGAPPEQPYIDEAARNASAGQAAGRGYASSSDVLRPQRSTQPGYASSSDLNMGQQPYSPHKTTAEIWKIASDRFDAIQAEADARRGYASSADLNLKPQQQAAQPRPATRPTYTHTATDAKGNKIGWDGKQWRPM